MSADAERKLDDLLNASFHVQSMRDMIKKDLAPLFQGYKRYEFIRCLPPVKFAELWERNLKGEGAFDDLVDQEMEKANEA